MNDIRGIPYREVRFDKKGSPENRITLPQGTSDLYTISHGWNNNDFQARALYRKFFETFDDITNGWPERNSRVLCILGILWPSKALDDTVTAAIANQGGAAGVGDLDEAAEDTILLKLEKIKELFSRELACDREGKGAGPESRR